jgi:hypothetical protein
MQSPTALAPPPNTLQTGILYRFSRLTQKALKADTTATVFRRGTGLGHEIASEAIFYLYGRMIAWDASDTE